MVATIATTNRVADEQQLGLQLQGPVQTFNYEASEEEEEETVEKSSAKAKKVVKKVAGNVIKGALCGVHGFIFGISSCIATKAQAKLHERSVQNGEGATITVTVNSVSNLKARTIRGKELSITPVVRAKVDQQNLDNGPANQLLISPGVKVDKTANPQGKIVFNKEGKASRGCLLMPVNDLQAAKNTRLIFNVEDTPLVLGTVASVVKGSGYKGRNLTIGTAILSLGELVAAADINPADIESRTVELPAKLSLWTGEGHKEPAGEICITVSITA
jgi:hypothetical protein